MTAVLTPANQLTLLRMLLIPVLAILLIYGYSGAALITFCFAGLTDLFDGLIARWSGQNSELGAWLDPMADKLLLVTTFIVLTLPLEHMPNRLPVWLTVLMISRDVGIVLTVAVVNLAIGRRTFMPSIFGKIATATFILTGVATLYFNFLGRHSVVVDVGIYASLAATVVSSLHYIWKVTRVGRFSKFAPQSPPDAAQHGARDAAAAQPSQQAPASAVDAQPGDPGERRSA